MAYFTHLTREQKGDIKAHENKVSLGSTAVLHERDVCDGEVLMYVFLTGLRQRSAEEECVKWCFYKQRCCFSASLRWLRLCTSDQESGFALSGVTHSERLDRSCVFVYMCVCSDTGAGDKGVCVHSSILFMTTVHFDVP